MYEACTPVSTHFQFFFFFRLTFCLRRVRNIITLALRYLFTPPQRQYNNHVNGSAVWPQAFRAAPRIPIVIVIIIMMVSILPTYLSLEEVARRRLAPDDMLRVFRTGPEASYDNAV